ncbi:hypothetical protein BGZ54_010055 [Gamsiella multidivaricata]|nr:hypothetical protein BGZ54_010055 [Gamsiella multidivaricata]
MSNATPDWVVMFTLLQPADATIASPFAPGHEEDLSFAHDLDRAIYTAGIIEGNIGFQFLNIQLI